MGTIVNAAAIVIASLLGLKLRSFLSKQLEHTLQQMVGIVVMLIGLIGVLKAVLLIDPVTMELQDQGILLLLVSLVIGVVLGETWNLEDKLYRAGAVLERKFQKEGFANAFISASMIFCIGAMAIVGSIQDGINHDPSVLYVKAALDFITAMILASALGFGVLFSGISVLFYQGLITVLASGLAPYASPQLIQEICMVGYVLVLCIGLNFVGNIKIRTANALPAMLIPIAYQMIRAIFHF